MLRRLLGILFLKLVLITYLVNATIPVIDSQNNPVCNNPADMTWSYTSI